MKIKLIAFDLDGTLLRADKSLSTKTMEALYHAAERDVILVLATGRLYKSIPVELQRLPFLRYIITVNGAEVFDAAQQRTIYRAEMSASEVKQVLAFTTTLPALHGYYHDGRGFLEQKAYHNFENYSDNIHMSQMLREAYEPIENIPNILLTLNQPIQEIQLYFSDLQKRDELFEVTKKRFSQLAVSSSLRNDIEFNVMDANKGAAVNFLCDYLGVNSNETMAFGDATNDLSMIHWAGIGVAMGNACEEVKAAADHVTLCNDEDGVANMIEMCIERGLI